MELQLIRDTFKETLTFGKLYVNGVYQCETLEDKVRPDGVKVYGETAIPEGTYVVTLTRSKRLEIITPQLHNVPNFGGIRIHSLNFASQTKGCPGVGTRRGENSILNSRLAFKMLMQKLELVPSSEQITIEVKSSPKVVA